MTGIGPTYFELANERHAELSRLDIPTHESQMRCAALYMIMIALELSTNSKKVEAWLRGDV